MNAKRDRYGRTLKQRNERRQADLEREISLAIRNAQNAERSPNCRDNIHRPCAGCLCACHDAELLDAETPQDASGSAAKLSTATSRHGTPHDALDAAQAPLEGTTP